MTESSNIMAEQPADAAPATPTEEQAADPEYDSALKEVEKSCADEIRSKMAALNTHMGSSFDTQLAQFEQRFESNGQAQEAVSESRLQTADVLRVNKIIREVARGLGSDWRLCFHYLMSAFPKDEIEAEVDRISIQRRPYTQAYKALTTWRDMTGEFFEVGRLVEVLEKCERQELADRVTAILECDAQTLLQLSDAPTPREDAVPELGQQRLLDDDKAFKRASINHYMDSRKSTLPASDRLDDASCLALARRLGSAWVALAERLAVPADEVAELKAEDAGGHQAAFRMLYAWREAQAGAPGTSAQLAAALTDIGQGELSSLVAPASS